MGSFAWWLENPGLKFSSDAWSVTGHGREVSLNIVSYTGGIGVRPAIEVLKSNIEY